MVLVDQDRSAGQPRPRRPLLALGLLRAGRRSRTTRGDVDPWLRRGPRAGGARHRRGLRRRAGERRRAARVQVIADGSDASSRHAWRSATRRAHRPARGGRTRVRATARPGAGAARGRPGAIELVPRVCYNPDLKSRWFYVPAVLAMILMIMTMLLSAMAVVREKEIGTHGAAHRDADPLLAAARGQAAPVRGHRARRRCSWSPRVAVFWLRRAAARLVPAAARPHACSSC